MVKKSNKEVMEMVGFESSLSNPPEKDNYNFFGI